MTPIGINWKQFRYQKWTGSKAASDLETAPYTSGGKDIRLVLWCEVWESGGLLVDDPWGKRLEGAPISEQARKELLRRQDDDRQAFSTHRSQPKVHGDAASRHLDSITLEQHLIEDLWPEPHTIRTFLSPIAGGGSGLGADALSAYAEYAADVLLPWQYDKGRADVSGREHGRGASHSEAARSRTRISGGTTMEEICRGGATSMRSTDPGQPGHAFVWLLPRFR